MFLKLKEFCGILFHPEESVLHSIVHVGPYLVALVCIQPFIDYLFWGFIIFCFLYFYFDDQITATISKTLA